MEEEKSKFGVTEGGRKDKLPPLSDFTEQGLSLVNAEYLERRRLGNKVRDEMLKTDLKKAILTKYDMILPEESAHRMWDLLTDLALDETRFDEIEQTIYAEFPQFKEYFEDYFQHLREDFKKLHEEK